MMRRAAPAQLKGAHLDRPHVHIAVLFEHRVGLNDQRDEEAEPGLLLMLRRRPWPGTPRFKLPDIPTLWTRRHNGHPPVNLLPENTTVVLHPGGTVVPPG